MPARHRPRHDPVTEQVEAEQQHGGQRRDGHGRGEHRPRVQHDAGQVLPDHHRPVRRGRLRTETERVHGDRQLHRCHDAQSRVGQHRRAHDRQQLARQHRARAFTPHDGGEHETRAAQRHGGGVHHPCGERCAEQHHARQDGSPGGQGHRTGEHHEQSRHGEHARARAQHQTFGHRRPRRGQPHRRAEQARRESGGQSGGQQSRASGQQPREHVPAEDVGTQRSFVRPRHTDHFGDVVRREQPTTKDGSRESQQPQREQPHPHRAPTRLASTAATPSAASTAISTTTATSAAIPCSTGASRVPTAVASNWPMPG